MLLLRKLSRESTQEHYLGYCNCAGAIKLWPLPAQSKHSATKQVTSDGPSVKAMFIVANDEGVNLPTADYLHGRRDDNGVARKLNDDGMALPKP